VPFERFEVPTEVESELQGIGEHLADGFNTHPLKRVDRKGNS
jgi:hypothetical protein